ncbi:F-box/FBD/LRR-repeat protein [Tanacetum coccineum]
MNISKSYSELDDILYYLSGKSVKKLALEFNSCSLPSSLFSLIHLTDLCLIGCDLDHEPICSINSLGRLTNLHLEELGISTEDLVYFLSKCPLLKTVTMNDQFTYGGICDTGTSTIIDMFECLPMIENLSISSNIIQLPTGLVHLKYICIEDMGFDYDYEEISRLGLVLRLLLRSSLNLERLVVKAGESESGSFTVEDFSDIWLEHLNEFTIENIMIDYKRMNTNDELEFTKLHHVLQQLVLQRLESLLCPRAELVSLHECDSAAGPLDIRASPSALSYL